jgi:ketosteroid isomerase-like protein
LRDTATLHTRLFASVLLLALAGLGTCSGPRPTASLQQQPATPAFTSTPQPASDEEAIRQLILLEGRGVVAQDITGLMGLWAEDAVITDAKHTPDDPSDDAHWRGRDAIRDRYVVLVFPGNPTSAGATDINIVINGDTAEAVSTTRIGDEVSPGGDRWTFVKRDGRWWITSLTYNLEPE